MENPTPTEKSGAACAPLKKRTQWPAEKTLYVFASLAVVGGFLEAYTYLLHGGVFCNAQTGNLVLLCLALIGGRFADAGHYALSLLAYVFGILVSAALPFAFKRLNLHLTTAVIETLAFAAIAFIPESASDWYTYVSVAFLCAVQYNTFTECRGAVLSTTFCTNNLRQTTLNVFRAAAEKDKEKLKKGGVYAFVIVCFALGAVAGGFAARYMGNYSVLLCSAVLFPVCVRLFAQQSARGKRGRGPSDAA